MKYVAMILVAVAMSFTAQSNAMADCGCENSCGCEQSCGCGNGCGKVCKLECTETEIEVTCYGCKCDHICIPCPSTPGCRHCDTACGGGKDCDCCTQGAACKFCWTDWCPGGANVKQVKKLVKYTAKKKVPSYKWKVVDACSCGEGDVTKPAPTSARNGDRFPLSQYELNQVSATMVRNVPAQRAAVATDAPEPPATAWSLFSK
jgi:hypothetical protein